MGLSHRIAYRLFNIHERKKNLTEFRFSQRSMIAQALHSDRSKKLSSRRPFAIGIALVVHLGCLSIHLRNLPAGRVSILPLVALFLSFISLVRLLIWLDEISDANSPLFVHHGRNRSEFFWKRAFKRLISRTKMRLIKLEQTYLRMRNFALLINQLVFFSLCERTFLKQRQPITSFYTLMFYNVIAYCVSYIEELIEREDWSVFIKVAKGSNVRHLAMSATNIVLEWTKAVTFIMTIVFILLVSGLDKGLKNYAPSNSYLVATAAYFILTEKVFVDLIFRVFEEIKFDCFENMERLYSPVILKGVQILLSLAMTITCGMLGYVRITALAGFTNVRAKYKELDDDHWQPLKRELIKLIDFRSANRDEIRRHDDVCAVCLTPMRSARVTPCLHLFHAECLRRCLTEASHQCPICKHQLNLKCTSYFAASTS